MAFIGLFFVMGIFIIILLIIEITDLIFSVLGIVFSCLSASRSNKFICAPKWQDYRRASGFYAPSLVFFILNCIALPLSVIMIIFVALLLTDEAGSAELGKDIAVFFIFLIPFFAVIVAFALGICALAKHSKAKKIYRSIAPPTAPYAYGQGYTYVSVQAQPNIPPQNFYTTEQNEQAQPAEPFAPAQKKCAQCGTVNDENHKFCTNCGFELK